jgi:site-specific recombinase XerD
MVSTRQIGKREIAALQPGQVIWDGAISGFGARRQVDAVSYVLFYRAAEGRQRWHTIGRHGSPWTPDTARREAKRLLGSAGGIDPAALKQAKRSAQSVAELCDLYLADAEAGRILTRRKAAKKASTIFADRGRIERHIKPLLGTMSVPAVTRADVESFMHAVAEGKTAMRRKMKKGPGIIDVRGGKGTATRTVGLLGSIFTYAVRHHMRPDNPVRGVERFADGQRQRRLTEDEYAALGAALRKATGDGLIWPPAVALTRFLLLTGWRRGEAIGLRPSELDLGRRIAVLGDSKTGRSMRPLSTAAVKLLRSAMTDHKPVGTVFPASRGDGLMIGYPKLWERIAKLAGLPADVTPHVLRHSFASLAADMGYSEPTIAALIGHAGGSVTSRYIHSADSVLLAAADAVARRTLKLAGDLEGGVVVPMRAGG